jgi:ABC-type glycerol-3-phosphate transport system substrate-binding protein
MRILAILVAATVFLAACSSGPESAATRFMTAAAKGHTAEAVELLDPQLKETLGPKLPLVIAGAQRQADAKGGLKSVKAKMLSQDGDYATVQISILYNDESGKTETARLRRVQGKWYITM